MTTIRVRCAHCATVTDVPTGALLLAVDDPAVTDEPVGTATWLCPGCGGLAATQVGAPLLDALRAAGVDLLDVDYTDPRPGHPEQPSAGDPFTPDDLLSLHEQLDTDAWFTALTALSAGCGQP